MADLAAISSARDQYTIQLKRILTPLIVQGITSLYIDACNSFQEDEECDEIHRLVRFQKLLKVVPKWNQHVIDAEVERITGVCDWINDILTAVVSSHVKILCSVKLNTTDKQFRFNMPSLDNFIHEVYINAARANFHNPYLSISAANNKIKRDSIAIVEEAIDEAIQNLLPVQSILSTYVNLDEENLDASTQGEKPIEAPEGEEAAAPEGEDKVMNFDQRGQLSCVEVDTPPAPVPVPDTEAEAEAEAGFAAVREADESDDEIGIPHEKVNTSDDDDVLDDDLIGDSDDDDEHLRRVNPENLEEGL